MVSLYNAIPAMVVNVNMMSDGHFYSFYSPFDAFLNNTNHKEYSYVQKNDRKKEYPNGKFSIGTQKVTNATRVL